MHYRAWLLKGQKASPCAVTGNLATLSPPPTLFASLLALLNSPPAPQSPPQHAARLSTGKIPIFQTLTTNPRFIRSDQLLGRIFKSLRCIYFLNSEELLPGSSKNFILAMCSQTWSEYPQQLMAPSWLNNAPDSINFLIIPVLSGGGLAPALREGRKTVLSHPSTPQRPY